MPNISPNISEAEWEVIKVIWDAGKLTAGEVVAALGPTVQRYLDGTR